MLHLLFDKNHWFETRGRRWNARPVRWQAHLLIAIFLLALIGVEVAMNRDGISTLDGIMLVIFTTATFMLIVAKRSGPALSR